MHPRIPLAFLAARARCWLMVTLSSTRTPRSLSAEIRISPLHKPHCWEGHGQETPHRTKAGKHLARSTLSGAPEPPTRRWHSLQAMATQEGAKPALSLPGAGVGAGRPSPAAPRQAAGRSLVTTQDPLLESYKPVLSSEHHSRGESGGDKRGASPFRGLGPAPQHAWLRGRPPHDAHPRSHSRSYSWKEPSSQLAGAPGCLPQEGSR